MPTNDQFEKIEVTNPAQLRDWLETNHASEASYWLVTYKKSEGDKYVSVQQVLDELIAFGWIDGIRRKLDDARTMQLISKRKVQHWSKSYKDRAATLIEEGQMLDAGLASIEEGKSNGLWHFMDDVDALITPDDLAMQLRANQPSLTHFDAYPNGYKRNVLRWLKLAKTDRTRQKRIAEIVTTSKNNARIPQM
ncbi:MAG: YdeI/OmpD-associated family protein [Pseudomonadota bacterium]